VQIDVTEASDPQAALLKAIAAANITDAITRLIYRFRLDQIAQIDDRTLHEALAVAHNYTIIPEAIDQAKRARLPDLSTAEALDPISALQAYLSTREDLRNSEPALMQAARELMGEDRFAVEVEIVGDRARVIDGINSKSDATHQLMIDLP
jgi:DNA repair protein SbcD/Mre11